MGETKLIKKIQKILKVTGRKKNKSKFMSNFLQSLLK